MFFRPDSKFESGMLVQRSNEVLPAFRFMLIKARRWIRPNGKNRKQWVYDGVGLEVKDGSITASTFISCVLEGNIVKVC